MYIFYRPDSLQIVGASDCEISMEFPYIKIKEEYHSLDGLFLEREGKKVVLKVSNMTIGDRIEKEKKVRSSKGKVK